LLSSGEEAQFLLFYGQTSEALHRKAYRMCRGNVADADDAHQRTYLQALKHWRTTLSGMADKRRSAWLATALANEVLQIWRSPHRSREAAGPGDPGWDPAGPTAAADEDAVVAADDLNRACRAIAQLEGRQLEVVALHCLAGYEISEVAEMLGISPVTVRVHLHAGRANVRKILTRKEDDPPDG
jgi:RNA polymerase sigma factor (sigma-70 family)